MSFKKIERNLNKLQKQIEKEILKGVEEALLDLSAQSLTECPLDTGNLRESYKVDVNGDTVITGTKKGKPIKIKKIKEIKDEKIEAEASYNTDYALIQHEDLTFYHPTPGTKAKYLEDPLKNNEQKYVDIITDKVKRVIDK